MKPSTMVLTLLGSLWLLAIIFGLCLLMQYENTPGVAAKAPSRWLSNSSISLNTSGPTLIMLAHPQCSCTKASLVELRNLSNRYGSGLKTYVLFLEPTKKPPNWQDSSESRKLAETIPGATVLDDKDGIVAKRLNSVTSGQTLLYGADGQLLFSGGITAARGHIGNSLGSAAIVSTLQNQPVTSRTTAVFGCPLVNDDSK